MEVTFHNVRISVEADDARAAYTKLCDALAEFEFITDSYCAPGVTDEDTSKLWLEEEDDELKERAASYGKQSAALLERNGEVIVVGDEEDDFTKSSVVMRAARDIELPVIVRPLAEANAPADILGLPRIREGEPDLLSVLQSLFEHCAMIHKHWGEGSNAKEADEAIANARAAIAKATHEKE